MRTGRPEAHRPRAATRETRAPTRRRFRRPDRPGRRPSQAARDPPARAAPGDPRPTIGHRRPPKQTDRTSPEPDRARWPWSYALPTGSTVAREGRKHTDPGAHQAPAPQPLHSRGTAYAPAHSVATPGLTSTVRGWRDAGVRRVIASWGVFPGSRLSVICIRGCIRRRL